MVPPDSDRIPLVPPYSGSRSAGARVRLRGSHPLRPGFPAGSAPRRRALSRPYNPAGARPRGLGSSPFARHYLGNHVCSLLLRLLRCFSSPRSPPPWRMAHIRCAGLPHSDTRGSALVCSSPRIFAACRVLHRLLSPRHPPPALPSFKCLKEGVGGTSPTFRCLSYCFVHRRCAVAARQPFAFPYVKDPSHRRARRAAGVCGGYRSRTDDPLRARQVL